MGSDETDERGMLAEQAVPLSKQRAVRDGPHYLGHRERLRERFASAGHAALPDYELLELLLFRLIPRAGTDPAAKPTGEIRGPAIEAVVPF